MRQRVREYRGMLWELKEREGWHAYRWVAVALGLALGVWVPPLLGGIAASYMVAGGSLPAVTAGTVITLGLGALGTSAFNRRPWHRVLVDRVEAYADLGDPTDYSRSLVALDDFHTALHALRRSGLNALATRCPSPPDAPHLNLSLYVFRPPISVQAGQERVSDQTWRVLREARVDARVDGRLPNGDPIPVFVPAP